MAPVEREPDTTSIVQAAMQAATATVMWLREGDSDALSDRLADLDRRCSWEPGTFRFVIRGLTEDPS